MTATIRAAAMPQARARLLRWLEGRAPDPAPDPGVTLGAAAPFPPAAADAPDPGAAYAAWLARMIRDADLYHVSESMTTLAVGAAGSLPSFRLHPAVLPSDCGLLCWESLIEGADGRKLIGAAWTVFGGQVWVELLTVFPEGLHEAVAVAAVAQVRAMWEAIGRLQPDVSMSLPLDREFVWNDATGGRAVASSALVATWLLMGQTLTESEVLEQRPSDRRRAARRGEPPSPVTYVQLRKVRHLHDGEETGRASRDHSHRWVVRGHWRRQWYPSVDAHRPIWIDPHLKGPEGAPLLHRERVYTFRR